jgi:hypothetical protein
MQIGYTIKAISCAYTEIDGILIRGFRRLSSLECDRVIH